LATNQWTELFPNDFKSAQESLLFVKRMMVVAVSSITYLRGIFPEDAYRSRYLEDFCIKILRENCNTPGAAKIKMYRRRVLLPWLIFASVCADPDEPNRIIESYHFKFRYSAKGPEMDILRNNGIKMQVTMDDTKKALVLLIRKLFLLMQNLDVLPSNVYLTMKLYYYDEITPADYQPPGFKEGECDSLWFEGVAVNFRVGEVETPFHTLKIAVSAEQDRVEKLQKGNHLGETKQVSQGAFPEKEIEKDVEEMVQKASSDQRKNHTNSEKLSGFMQNDMPVKLEMQGYQWLHILALKRTYAVS
uniref:HORMA domain-containing protein 1-like n=1 Tax=Pundamilia nyererei TaxID=303518 RepID=A0A3B4GZ43_9CICH